MNWKIMKISSEFDDFSMEDALKIANAASHVKRY